MRDRVVPLRDRRRVGQRRRQPLRQQPRAGRGHGAVDGGEQRAAPLAAERADRARDWRGWPGRSASVAPSRLAHRRRQRRPLAELRALHIGDAGGGGGQLQPRQRAERLRGRDREIRRQPPLGGGAVEHVAGQRRHRRQRAQERRQLRVGIERVGDDDLARLEPRQLGRRGRRGRIRRCGTRRWRCRSRRARSGSPSSARRRARAGERQQIVVAPRVEQRVLGQRAGRHQADDVAPHHALGAALAAPRPGPRSARRPRRGGRARSGGAGTRRRGWTGTPHIGMSRPRCLPRLVSTMPSARRGDLGVLEEQLVEIAHPVEQQAIRIGGLDLDVLLHDRRGARRAASAGGSDAKPDGARERAASMAPRR